MANLIWWLTAVDMAAIGPQREMWPTWLAEEFVSLQGRAGRGRLWVAPLFEGQPTTIAAGAPAWETPIGKHAQMCGGIMIREEDLPHLAYLPGIVTDLKLQRWEARGATDQAPSLPPSPTPPPCAR